MKSSIGPLAAICAVFFLATPVTASASDSAETVAAAAHKDHSDEGDTTVTPQEQTLQAEKAAANNAADRLLENTRLDLDIRLIGHSSKTVAASH